MFTKTPCYQLMREILGTIFLVPIATIFGLPRSLFV